MSLANVFSRAQYGIEAPLVRVEIDLSRGLPGMTIVGLAETAVKESRERVRCALLNSRFEIPKRRVIINLAPADLPKDGGRFDLAIALGLLAASGQISATCLEGYEFLGELALNGELRSVKGALPAALQTFRAARKLIVPQGNAAEAGLITGLTAYAGNHLLNVVAHLQNQEPLPLVAANTDLVNLAQSVPGPDLSEVFGQHSAKRALEIVAAGGHSCLFIGPPGTGKTMLANRLPGLLPPMSEEEALESAAIRSISHLGFNPLDWRRRPFRSPHHTASSVALVGGGSVPRPGEISLAHQGVLFLDELPEFDRRVLDVLREPLESGRVIISRAARQAEYPARFQLMAAMNPCSCGYLGDPEKPCRCSVEQVRRYRQRLSGPLLDRIDLHLQVPRVPFHQLRDTRARESSAAVRTRVIAAQTRQRERSGRLNAHLETTEVQRVCDLTEQDQQFLEQTLEKLHVSARAYHKILKLARTLADLEAEPAIQRVHLTEALGYRCLDRVMD